MTEITLHRFQITALQRTSLKRDSEYGGSVESILLQATIICFTPSV